MQVRHRQAGRQVPWLCCISFYVSYMQERISDAAGWCWYGKLPNYEKRMGGAGNALLHSAVRIFFFVDYAARGSALSAKLICLYFPAVVVDLDG